MTWGIYILAQAGSDTVGIVGGTTARDIILGLLTGIAFGAILQRVGASSFEMIVNMLRLKNLTIMKFLFLAIAVGSVGMYTVAQFWPQQSHIGIAPLYLLGLTVGGLIFGAGWAISGYCPGTVLAALGEGKVDAVFTILGGLAGALTLALTWDWIKPVLVDPLNYGSKSIPDMLGAQPLLMAVVFAVLVIIFILWLDRLGRSEVTEPGGRHGLLEGRSAPAPRP
ncbi:MAG: YeeE/YedE thiosulfate transporter family protein [Thermoleophilia bacterium]